MRINLHWAGYPFLLIAVLEAARIWYLQCYADDPLNFTMGTVDKEIRFSAIMGLTYTGLGLFLTLLASGRQKGD